MKELCDEFRISFSTKCMILKFNDKILKMVSNPKTWFQFTQSYNCDGQNGRNVTGVGGIKAQKQAHIPIPKAMMKEKAFSLWKNYNKKYDECYSW